MTTTKDGQASGNVLNQSYTYDSLGNLTTRADNSPGVGTQESFSYDSLNRLTLNTLLGGAVSPPPPERLLIACGVTCRLNTSAVFGKFATNTTDGWDAGVAQGTVAAVAGGVGSVIAGGKFQNGAVTGAFGYLFNYCSSGKCTDAFEQAMYDLWPGYKAGTLLYNQTMGDGSWTGWEVPVPRVEQFRLQPPEEAFACSVVRRTALARHRGGQLHLTDPPLIRGYAPAKKDVQVTANGHNS